MRTAKGILSLVGVAALAVALAGCAKAYTVDGNVVVSSEPMSASTALGMTGSVLLIPAIITFVVWLYLSIDWEYSWDRSDYHKRIARFALIISIGIVSVSCLLWIAAIWLGVGK